MNVGSLFSGIGGLDLGLERAGMTVIWQSEIDPYASKVLAKHWPTVPNLGDITAIDWSTVERPDLICGGYPCQPFSLAGVRRGESDPRHLWPYFHRAVRDLRPRYALLENVPGHLSMGFDRVLGDLAEIGYDTEWCSIPAAAVGAPHLRWRIFAVAYLHGESEPEQPVDAFTRSGVMVPDTPGGGRDGRPDRPGVRRVPRIRSQARKDAGDVRPVLADTEGFPVGTRLRESEPRGERGRRPRDSGREGHAWAVEPDVGRVAHGVPSRVDRLRCLGNAVVPQVAEWIGRRIMEAAA